MDRGEEDEIGRETGLEPEKDPEKINEEEEARREEPPCQV